MALLVEAGAALRCGWSEDGNSSTPKAHVKISSLILFAKVKNGAQIMAHLRTPPVISTGYTLMCGKP